MRCYAGVLLLPLEIKRLTTRQWGVIGDGDSPIFTGSLQECRLWLDLRDNISDARQSRWWQRILRAFVRIVTLRMVVGFCPANVCDLKN